MAEKSKVYFTDMRVEVGTSILVKLQKLIKAAGINTIDMENRFVAIKIHFGEPGNISFLRPNFARAVVDVIKENGGIPFLTDSNTLYTGHRKNALEHLETAYINGFTPYAVGCQILIGDGLRGLDEVDVPVNGGEYIKEAHIGRAIMDADVVISLSHFKGHELTGFGGAIKNLGMGAASRAGKMAQHNAGKPEVDPERCRSCRLCSKYCAQDAISYPNKKAVINHDLCAGCGRCIGVCNFDAIYNPNDDAEEMLCAKMAEYTKAIVDGRPQFHISIAMDISPYCDCHGENDAPIIPDVGIFASFDPVAIDAAAADMCNKQQPIENSLLGDSLKNGCDHHDHFTNVSPNTNWRATLDHAEKIGLGTQDYELVVIK